MSLFHSAMTEQTTLRLPKTSRIFTIRLSSECIPILEAVKRLQPLATRTSIVSMAAHLGFEKLAETYAPKETSKIL